MPLHGSHNRGIWHAVLKFGQQPLCRSRRANMVCEIPAFRDRDQCKRCAAKLAAMDERAAKKANEQDDFERGNSAYAASFAA